MRFTLEKLVDILLACIVISVVALTAWSLRDESIWQFDDFVGELEDMHEKGLLKTGAGEVWTKEFAHLLILDQQSAVLYFDTTENIRYKYDTSELEYLKTTPKTIEIVVPAGCKENCICFARQFQRMQTNQLITLTPDAPYCKNLGFDVTLSSTYSQNQIYSFLTSNSWVIERGLQKFQDEDIYNIDYDEDEALFTAVSNQLQSRRRPVYLSFNNGGIDVYQFDAKNHKSYAGDDGIVTQRQDGIFEEDQDIQQGLR